MMTALQSHLLTGEREGGRGWRNWQLGGLTSGDTR